MKKKLLFSALLLCFLTTYSQETAKLTSKKGSVILPESGDWSIGVSATPFLNYVGNFLKITQNPNDAPTFGFTAQNPGIIVGKLQTSELEAIRFGLLIGVNVDVENEPSIANNDQTTSFTKSALSFGINVGIERYKPLKSRLLGFYGVEGGLYLTPYSGLARNTNSYVVGRISYKDDSNSSFNYVEKGGNTFSFVAKGFIGVEYFFAPKLSLSGEFGLSFRTYYQTERKYEPEVGSKEVIDASEYGINLAPNASGDLVLRFYF